MKEGHITVQGCTLHYRESGDAHSPAVFLLHGNSMSSRCFEAQLNSTLAGRYHLIAIDLPGHGGSAATQLSDYNLPAYARLMSAAVQALQLVNPVLVGWSLGGHVLLQATRYLTDAAGLMLVGTPPLAKIEDAFTAFLPHPASVIYQEQVSRAEAQAFAQACLHPHASLDCEAMVTDIMATHGLARLGLLQPDVALTDEVAIAQNFHKPLAIVLGEGEQLVSRDYIESLDLTGLWGGGVELLAGVGHTPHMEAPAAFNALLDRFARDCLTHS